MHELTENTHHCHDLRVAAGWHGRRGGSKPRRRPRHHHDDRGSKPGRRHQPRLERDRIAHRQLDLPALEAERGGHRRDDAGRPRRGLRPRDRQAGRHRHERARRVRRHLPPGALRRRHPRDCPRGRAGRLERPRRDPRVRGRLLEAPAADVRRLLEGAGRLWRDRNRQPLRPRGLAYRRRDQRARPQHPGAEPRDHRRRDPDRCIHQSRQLGRPAARRERKGDRRELADRVELGRQQRRGLRDPVQHRATRRARDPRRQPGAACVPRRPAGRRVGRRRSGGRRDRRLSRGHRRPQAGRCGDRHRRPGRYERSRRGGRVQSHNPGDSVVLTVHHGGTSSQVSVKLANRAL